MKIADMHAGYDYRTGGDSGLKDYGQTGPQTNTALSDKQDPQPGTQGTIPGYEKYQYANASDTGFPGKRKKAGPSEGT